MSVNEPASQRWLAYELHDGLLQWVIGARLQLIAAHNREEQTTECYQRAIRKAISSLELALREARALIGYLEEQQTARGEARIVASLLRFVEGAQRDAELQQQRIETRVELAGVDDIDAVLDDALSWNLLRIAQQAVRNAITHAGPTPIVVTLRCRAPSKNLELIVEDQGRGFDTTQVPPEGRNFGLSSMSHRAQLIGAQLEIQSAVGAGCRVQCTLPINRPAVSL